MGMDFGGLGAIGAALLFGATPRQHDPMSADFDRMVDLQRAQMIQQRAYRVRRLAEAFRARGVSDETALEWAEAEMPKVLPRGIF